MTAVEAGNVAAQVAETPVRVVSSALYDLVLGVDRHRVGLAHELGLGTTDVAALWEVARRPGLRPGDLARALGLGVAGTSSVVDKLVRSGFVRRDPDPSDRRSLNLGLTPAGRHAHEWVEEQLDLVVARVLGDGPGAAATAAALRRLAQQFTTPED